MIAGSHSARSAWIETMWNIYIYNLCRSHSARSAWIETTDKLVELYSSYVALRKECVD